MPPYESRKLVFLLVLQYKTVHNGLLAGIFFSERFDFNDVLAPSIERRVFGALLVFRDKALRSTTLASELSRVDVPSSECCSLSLSVVLHSKSFIMHLGPCCLFLFFPSIT